VATSPSDALSEGVPDVGQAVRALRLRRKWTLKEVSVATGLSQSFLSQLELGRSNASLQSLQRIAKALDVQVAELFRKDGFEEVVLRRADRPTLAYGILGRKHLLTPQTSQNLEIFMGEFQAGGSTGEEQYTHGDSEELFLVMKGKVDLHLGEDIHVLEAGDRAIYKSSVPHKTVNVSDEPAEVLWVISPPSF
jgi:transcriptional regulator with XRE-family HTH domain